MVLLACGGLARRTNETAWTSRSINEHNRRYFLDLVLRSSRWNWRPVTNLVRRRRPRSAFDGGCLKAVPNLLYVARHAVARGSCARRRCNAVFVPVSCCLDMVAGWNSAGESS
jgi:hypothetical protein